MPQRYTCDGANCSPPLNWGDVPARARSLAILCDDPDAPNGTWRHWAAYDIPTQQTSLEEGAGARPGLAQAVNDFGRIGYGGPCPPHGDGPHRYQFRLLALSRDALSLPQHAKCEAVQHAARSCLVAEAQLVGVYAR